MLLAYGIKEIFGFNINGIVIEDDIEHYDFLTKELALLTNRSKQRLNMSEALKQADVFIGVSAPKLLDKDIVKEIKKVR